jgi:hypothetical protein
MPRDDLEIFHIAAALSTCLIAAGLYKWMGFFGVALLGLFILFVATTSISKVGAAWAVALGMFPFSLNRWRVKTTPRMASKRR